jgi:gamma-glutamyltranspeptidase/glutathione hydrolase
MIFRSRVAQIIANVIDFGMTVQEAFDAPRVHHQWIPDTLLYEKRALATDVVRNLGSMGYVLQEVEVTARAEALMIDSAGGWVLGGADPREEGYALGY